MQTLKNIAVLALGLLIAIMLLGGFMAEQDMAEETRYPSSRPGVEEYHPYTPRGFDANNDSGRY